MGSSVVIDPYDSSFKPGNMIITNMETDKHDDKNNSNNDNSDNNATDEDFLVETFV